MQRIQNAEKFNRVKQGCRSVALLKSRPMPYFRFYKLFVFNQHQLVKEKKIDRNSAINYGGAETELEVQD